MLESCFSLLWAVHPGVTCPDYRLIKSRPGPAHVWSPRPNAVFVCAGVCIRRWAELPAQPCAPGTGQRGLGLLLPVCVSSVLQEGLCCCGVLDQGVTNGHNEPCSQGQLLSVRLRSLHGFCSGSLLAVL